MSSAENRFSASRTKRNINEKFPSLNYVVVTLAGICTLSTTTEIFLLSLMVPGTFLLQ